MCLSKNYCTEYYYLCCVSGVFIVLVIYQRKHFKMYRLKMEISFLVQQNHSFSVTISVTMQKGVRAKTDALSRTLISHAKSPGTGAWTLDVPLTLGRLQTKEQKSTNQWAFRPTGGGKGRCRGSKWVLGWNRPRDRDEGDAWRLG